MGAIAARIAISLLTKFVTERFISKLVVYSCDHLAKKSTNELDDKLVSAIAEALDVKK